MAPRRLAEYEIYLPMRYNNGGKIPRRLVDQTCLEVLRRFGGYTLKKNVEGRITYSGRDRLNVLSVHTYETLSNDRWFRRFKAVLAQRFRQREIYITKKRLTVL